MFGSSFWFSSCFVHFIFHWFFMLLREYSMEYSFSIFQVIKHVLFKGDAANKDIFNFTHVQCWTCKWYQHVCICISTTDSGKYLRCVSALLLTSVPHLSIGAAPVCCTRLCRSKLPCPRARHMCSAVDLVHIRLTSQGACSHHTPAPLPLSSLPPCPMTALQAQPCLCLTARTANTVAKEHLLRKVFSLHSSF